MEAMALFDSLLKGVADVPGDVRKAITSSLFMGVVNRSGDIAEECCNFVLDLVDGLPVDNSFIVDGRIFNSRGGTGFERYVCKQECFV